jgi:hypothetical protein
MAHLIALLMPLLLSTATGTFWAAAVIGPAGLLYDIARGWM